MPIVPDRLWELMTDEEQAEVKAAISGLLGPTFKCPNCNSEVRVRVKLTFGATTLSTEEKTPPMRSSSDISDTERGILAEAKESGMFDAYEKALRVEKGEQMPKSFEAVEMLFLKFFRLGVPLKACSGAKDAYRRRYHGSLEFVQSNGVVGITEDRVLVEFAPLQYFKVQKGTVALRSPRAKTEEWIKTRFGYIPKASQIFANAMRMKSVGGFGRLVQ